MQNTAGIGAMAYSRRHRGSDIAQTAERAAWFGWTAQRPKKLTFAKGAAHAHRIHSSHYRWQKKEDPK
jgi:hypothetical protein